MSERPGAVWRVLPWLWLPAGITIAAAARGTMPFPMEPQAWLSLLVVAPCGLPLAAASRRLLALGYRTTAWVSFAVLAPLTAVASLFAGLLGPVAILIYALVLSGPAWIVYAALRGVERRKTVSAGR